MSLERLEDRLVMATLDVTGGALSYAMAGAGVANNVNLSLQTGVITFSDTGEAIILTANAMAAGFTNTTPNVVTGPDANVNSILINTGDGSDTITDASSDKPVTISPTSANPTPQAIFLGNPTTGTQSITNSVTIHNPNKTATLTVNDSASNVPLASVGINATSISGITGAGTVSFDAGILTSLTLMGGSGGNHIAFTGTASPTTTLDTGTGADSTFVQELDSAATLDIQGQSGADNVTIGNSSVTGQLGLGGVHGHVDVQNAVGTTNLTIIDVQNTSSNTFTVSGTQTTAADSGALITYPTASQIAGFTINGGSGGNLFTVTNTIPNVTSSFNTGPSFDTLDLEGTATGSVVNIDGNGAADQVNIGSSPATPATSVTSGILGTSVNVANTGINPSTDLKILDSGSTTGKTVTITPTQISGFTTGPINDTLNIDSRMDILGGSGGNSVTISNSGNTATVVPTFISSVAGTNTYIFANQAILNGGTITGGTGIDTLNYAAYTTPVVVDLTPVNAQTATGTGGTTGIENVVGSSTAPNTLTAPAGVSSVLTGGSGDDDFIIPASAGSVTVTGNGGADNLLIYAAGNPESFDTTNPTDTPGSISTVVTGAFATHTVNAVGINTLELTGGLVVAGTAMPGSTTATLDFSGGNPIPAGGVTYNGGGGTINELVLVNNLPVLGDVPYSFTNEVYDPTGPGAGTLILNDSAITSAVPSATNSVISFGGLSPVDDSVSAQNLTINLDTPLAPPQGNNVGITSATVNGFAGTQVASTDTPPGFESDAFANKANVTVNSVLPSETAVTVDDPAAGAGLNTFTVNTGSGADFINLIATPPAVSLAVNSGDGTDTFSVDGAGVNGPTAINGGTATNTLTYDAGGFAVAEVPGANSTLPSTLQLAPLGTTSTLTFTNFTTVNVNNIADLPLTNTPASIKVQAGQTFTGVVGSFTVSNPTPIANQVNPTPSASDFVATINWGDGTITAGTIVANGTGGFNVVGTHAYALATTPGTDPITVTVTQGASTTTTTTNGTTTTLSTTGGSTTTITSNATVTDAPISLSSAPVLATEGSPIPVGTVLATFTDPSPFSVVGSFSGTVNFGDGSAIVPVTITASTVAGTYLVTTASPQTYAKEGLYTVTVTINETGGLSDVSTATATVKAATLTLTVTPPTTITDGNAFTGQLATFTDANASGTASQFTATINWGDGSPSTIGTITQPGGVGTAFVVDGTHTYKTGTYSYTVTINETDPVGGLTTTGTGTVTVAAATITTTPISTFTAVVAQPITVQLGTFTTTNLTANLLQFSASINWGDGITTTGTIAQASAGVFSITGTHTFAEASNARAITVTITDANGGGTATISDSATVADAPLTSTGVAVVAMKGTPVPVGTLVATFSSANPAAVAGNFTATINWGDGTTTTGTVTSAGGSVSGFLVTSATAHTYATVGSFVIQVTITDTNVLAGATGSSTVATSKTTVTDGTITATGIGLSPTEGVAFTALVATFTDSDPASVAGDFNVAINWGDGIITPGAVSASMGGGFAVDGTHTYLTAGSYPVTVTISDAGGASAIVTTTATVSPAALTAGPALTLTETRGVPFTSVELGTFTSANPLATASQFTVSINWEDAAPAAAPDITAGTILKSSDGTFHVSGSHTYETAVGTPVMPVVTVLSSSGATTTFSPTVNLVGAPIVATGLPVVSVSEANPPPVLTVATFTDLDPSSVASNFSVMIQWGDGTSSTGSSVTLTPDGTSFQGAVFTISAPHSYTDPGSYVITTTITSVGGNTTTVYSSSTVTPGGIGATGIPVTGTQRQPLVNVPLATFVDLDGLKTISDYSATINWGDGTLDSPGVITGPAADGVTFTVSGSHTYSLDGTYPVTVTITDNAGAKEVVTTTATITEVPPTILVGVLDPASDSGVSNTDKITNVTNPIFYGSTNDPNAIINLYSNEAGVITNIGTGQATSGGLWAIQTSFIPDGSYAIYATATDLYHPNEVSFPIALLGGTSGLPNLVIDTMGPLVTEAIFRPSIGKVQIAIQDPIGGGLTTAEVADGADFRFSVYGKTSYPPNLVTGISVIRSGGPNDPIEEYLTINKGKKLPSGRYEFTISSAITDIAGNALDGEFYGYFPSGNGKPGSNFQALLVSNQTQVFAAMPTTTSASPLIPPGKTPKGYKTSTSSSNSHADALKAASVKPASLVTTAPLDVHDEALSLVTVKSAKKKK